MKIEQWEVLKKCARIEAFDFLPIGLIVDSPWIPGYLGISTLDYFTIPEIWLEANLKVEETFPEVIFLPGMWVEFGMCAEPSGFGCKVAFFEDKTPLAYPLLGSIDEVGNLIQPDPRKDGLMPLIINQYRYVEGRLADRGHQIKIVAARGPMATASHIMGVTEFLLGLKIKPDKAHTLLKMTTQLTIDWLEAQANTLSDVEGVMVLDDLVGFLGPDDYKEFAHPYFSKIFQRFPGALKFFHNDTKNSISYSHLSEWKVDIFNFTHTESIENVRNLVGPDICLMGNIAPLGVMVSGTPKDVRESVEYVKEHHPGPGLLLSAGGGISPGTPGENIRALVAAARE
jgi:uroporphyrinogen decarboxylase